MIAVTVVVLEALCCLGLGAAGLRALKIDGDLDSCQRFVWSFSLGFGILGWLLFFFGIAGLYSSAPLVTLLVGGSAGIYFLRGSVDLRGSIELSLKSVHFLDVMIIAAFAVVFVFDVFEGLSPPGDADSLAYHFAMPKQFLETGWLEFVPRAIDGAIPFLVQMTYIPVLGLGGEKALTLWTMLSGWAVALFVYSLCRRHLDKRLSATIALILLTTPAVLYGGGSGQIEVRTALFVLLAASAIAETLRSEHLKYCLLAGFAVGFFVGAKYLGLLFALACGLTLLIKGQRVKQGALFSLGVLIAGFQWYLWNWWNTGDPLFPVLISTFGIGDQAIWPAEYQAWFKVGFPLAENEVPASLYWFLVYPFQATFAGFLKFESGRTGFGPIVILVLPFAILGAWRFRQKIFNSPLFPIFLIAALYYTFWFFTGSSQRVRHLLPVYPLLVVAIFVAAARFAETGKTMKPLVAALIMTVIIQVGGHGIFALNFLKYHLTSESRDAFLTRNVPGYTAVMRLKKLKKNDKVMITIRQLAYYISTPYYFAHQNHQALISLSKQTFNPKQFLSQLRKQDITHILIVGKMIPSPDPRSINSLAPELVKKGCGKVLDSFQLAAFSSRTLNLGINSVNQGHLFKILNYDCTIL